METLSGRLKWERTASGIRVQIPPRRWPAIFLIFWISFWLAGGSQAIHFVLSDPGSGPLLFMSVWLLMWALGVVIVSCTILWMLFGVVVLELDPARLEISCLLGGLQLRTWTYRPDEIRNLHFEPGNPWAFRQSRKYRAMQFEAGDRTRRFALEIKARDANALIRKMLEVCPISATLYQEKGPSEPGRLLDNSCGRFGKF